MFEKSLAKGRIKIDARKNDAVSPGDFAGIMGDQTRLPEVIQGALDTGQVACSVVDNRYHVSEISVRKRSKRYLASWGPGAASG